MIISILIFCRSSPFSLLTVYSSTGYPAQLQQILSLSSSLVSNNILAYQMVSRHFMSSSHHILQLYPDEEENTSETHLQQTLEDFFSSTFSG